MSMLFTTTVGLLSGIVGTGLGGLISITLHHSQAALGWLLGFSGGLMFAVVAFDLLTSAFDLGGLVWGLGGMLLGFVLILALDFLLRKLKPIASQHLATSFLWPWALPSTILPKAWPWGQVFLPPPVWALAWPL